MNIKKIQFSHYKAFKSFTVDLSDFDVLIGPNNSGKSTVVGALRILSEGIRKASHTKNSEFLIGPNGQVRGYKLNLEGIPVSLENVFYNYDQEVPAQITFTLENGNKLILFFPEQGVCYLVPECKGSVITVERFKQEFPVKIGFVPVLGPVEHEELLYQPEAARRALLSHRASRNFRNIWYHFNDKFEEFREMIKSTWPGMDISPPEIIQGDNDQKPKLVMFCPEERFPREIYWAGFGFQVWCQILTFVLQAKNQNSSLLVIDEPDIYLHSDLQRQLVNILQELGIQILIATHSIEIIKEVDINSILTIHKKNQRAVRIPDPRSMKSVYELLGSNVNPVLTQLAKTKRVLFLEGNDFHILSLFARRIRKTRLANQSDFSVVPVGGFSPSAVRDFSSGIEITLGEKITKAVIFDKDYRSNDEVIVIKKELSEVCRTVIIHERKEIENFLLCLGPINRAILSAIKKRSPEFVRDNVEEINIDKVLNDICVKYRSHVVSQQIVMKKNFIRKVEPKKSEATVIKEALEDVNAEWEIGDQKFKLVPGKQVLSDLNTYLQDKYRISLTPRAIVSEFHLDDIDPELKNLIDKIDNFSKQ